jgi:hypothetical protein
MATEAQSNANPPRPRRLPVVGVVVLLIIGGAVALPMTMEGGCSPLKTGASAGTEPMELTGRWMGMTLASADSAAARNLGTPGVVAGVVIVEVARDAISRSAQSGALPGDVILKVDGTTTQNLAELYTLTTRLNIARPLPLEIMRQGQPMTIVLPQPAGILVQPPMTAPGATPLPPQQAGWTPPAGTPLAAQPVAPATPLAPPQPVAPAPQQPNAAAWPVSPIAPRTGLPGVMGP